jgi:hypothetical protein
MPKKKQGRSPALSIAINIYGLFIGRDFLRHIFNIIG